MISRSFMRPSGTFYWKMYSWLHVLTLYQNQLNTVLPPYLFGAVFQDYLGCCLPGCSPHFAPNKIKHNSHSENQDHSIRSHHFMANRWESGNSEKLYFFELQNHCGWWLQPWNWKMVAPWKKSYDQPRQHIKNQRHYFANNGPSSHSYGFSSSHV